MSNTVYLDAELFDRRPAKTEVCGRCRGEGRVDVGYALCPVDAPLPGAPEGTVCAAVVGCFDVFAASREAAELAREVSRPVAFQCLDHLVVVRPGDDSEQAARAWWLRQYGETPEETRERR